MDFTVKIFALNADKILVRNELKTKSISIVILLFLWSCSPIKNSQYSTYSTLKAEPDECLTNYTYSTSVNLYGTAKFFKRGLELTMQATELKNMYLGDPIANALPIRFAEVAVYNSNNEIVQCGITDASGALKAFDGLSDLTVPASADTFTVHLRARSNITLSAPVASPAKPDFQFHVAIKKDFYTDEVHTLTQSVVANGVDDLSVPEFIAYARQTESLNIEGGAFNILNSILISYDYIRNNTAAEDISCLSEKLNVYWKAGFNPNQYVESTQDPSYISNFSFYDSGAAKLFITGGRLGDVAIDTTNHFDDFVIIHELGHHVENMCGSLKSPGGGHFILARIDPRLAWAEGWSNYLAAQVMFDQLPSIQPELPNKLAARNLSSDWTFFFGSQGITDSLQNINNGTGFMFDMKKSGSNPDTWQIGDFVGNQFDKVDPTRYPGEGHFREGAISRGLFKLTNNCGGTCITTTPIDFANIWRSMNSTTGIGQGTIPFKSSHSFMEILKTFITAGTWNTDYRPFNQLQTSEALHLHSDGIYQSGGINYWMPFAETLTTLTGGACAEGTLYIEPRTDDPVLTSTNSDQRYSNHYYTFDPALLSSVTDIQVEFAKQGGLSTTLDFDLILYEENFILVEDYQCTTYNSSGQCTYYAPARTTNEHVIRSDRRAGYLPTKAIRTLNLLDPTKKYLLNIRAYTPNLTISSETKYSYIIKDQTGQRICP